MTSHTSHFPDRAVKIKVAEVRLSEYLQNDDIGLTVLLRAGEVVPAKSMRLAREERDVRFTRSS